MTQPMRTELIFSVSKYIYKYIFKPIFFCFDPELVHSRMTNFGEKIGNKRFAKKIIYNTFNNDYPAMHQKIDGIEFQNPVGLAAGFDYEARLTQTLSSWGFGFQTIGTITNKPYGGNPKPILGRLPKSQSLMVNKGFKNPGAKRIIAKLYGKNFDLPLGVSIGRTNTKEHITLKQSIADILHTFIQFEVSKMKHSYYELNISCPNLYGNISFYPPENLKMLLSQVDMLKIKKPIYIKMPIEKSNEETLEMLKAISNSSSKGVIIGNLQKDRKNPAFDSYEVAKFRMGNFSGKPTFNRSNELIKLAYKNYKDRFTIIGCGGIFTTEDAYLKISYGASLIQLITGLIFEGPQLAAEINSGLYQIIQSKGYKNISEAIGSQA